MKALKLFSKSKKVTHYPVECSEKRGRDYIPFDPFKPSYAMSNATLDLYSSLREAVPVIDGVAPLSAFC